MRSALFAVVLAAAPASAQFGYNPYTGQGNGYGTPWGFGNGYGTPWASGTNGYGTAWASGTNGYGQGQNWNRPGVYMNGPQYQLAYQYSAQQAAFAWNPTLAPYWNASNNLTAGWNASYNTGNYNFQAGGSVNQSVTNGFVNPWGGQVVSNSFLPGQFGINQYEPGRFVRVGQDLAVNTVTGTILQPYSGVAYTNEGPFYRLPGTGTFSPYGAYLPGSGIYFNPFTGAAYNPRTGAVRR